MTDRMVHYPEHLRDVSYVGAGRYFLTFCTFERRKHFTSDDTVGLVSAQILRTLGDGAFEGTAYCFMPDHLHLLVEAQTDTSDLKRFIKLAKQRSAYYFKEAFDVRLWQRYGYERILRREESTPAVIRYIIANPVRTGLVEHPLDYRYWGSFTHSREALLEYIERAA
jgi:putative transposase